jgi:hypothetical protein
MLLREAELGREHRAHVIAVEQADRSVADDENG